MDMVAEAKYHHSCQIRFLKGRDIEGKTKGRPSGSVDTKKNDAFEKLGVNTLTKMMIINFQ